MDEYEHQPIYYLVLEVERANLNANVSDSRLCLKRIVDFTFKNGKN